MYWWKKIFQGHSIGVVGESKSDKRLVCMTHDKLAEVFCENCDKIICWMCSVQGEHRGKFKKTQEKRVKKDPNFLTNLHMHAFYCLEHVVLPLEEFKAKQRVKLGKITEIFQRQVQNIFLHRWFYLIIYVLLFRLYIDNGADLVDQTILDVNAAHEDVQNKITLAYKACKIAIQRRYDDLMRDSEQIRSSKGIFLSFIFWLKK